MAEPELRSKPIIASDRLLDMRLSRTRTINELRKNAKKYVRGGDNQALPLVQSLHRLIVIGRHQGPEGWLIGKLVQKRKLTDSNWKGLMSRYLLKGGSARSLDLFVRRATGALRFSGQYVEKATFGIPTVSMMNFRHTVNGAITFVNGRLERAYFTVKHLEGKK